MEPTNPAVLYKDLCGGRILCILNELDNDVILAVQLSLGLKESDASINPLPFQESNNGGSSAS